jgi:hypothetical protein
MIDGPRSLLRGALRRAHRVEHHERRKFHKWLENTNNLLHLSVLIFVPLLIGALTVLSNTLQQISFLLFPPLASGTYTLFSDPEGRYASPWRFVGGLTVGAFCGWIALEVVVLASQANPLPAQPHAGGAALGVLLTGLATWSLDLEEPAAFSTALLVLVTGTSQLIYVVSVGLSSGIVAGAFLVWRGQFYEQRARYLYQSTQADDHVLVPMRVDDDHTTARFGAQLAAAHEAGKVVLMKRWRWRRLRRRLWSQRWPTFPVLPPQPLTG